MHCAGMTFRLKPGCYPEYKKAHDDLWPDVAETMSSNNVSMVIYRYGDMLFCHATAPTEQDWLNSLEEVPAIVRWNEYMANYLVTDENNQIIFEDIELAFAFGDYE